jgi:hypothetical protein
MFRHVPVLLLVILVRVSPALGQGQAIDGIIEGVVRTESASAPVAAATVRAINAGTGYERAVATDGAGRYNLPLLPPGEYVLLVEAPGFATVSRDGLALRAGQVLTVEFSVSSAAFAESVQVTAEQPTVEVGRTVQSHTFDERIVRAVPTIGRSILDFFVLQPGVNAPPISSGGSGTGTPSTVYGGLGLRQMNVDGVSNNLQGGARNLVISQEAVQEFQTVTHFSAEFGRVAGGLQNAFTRSGSNAVHGSAYLFTRQDWLAERPFLLAPTAPDPEFERYNYGATAGGPLVRDRSFYFVSYERWSQDLPVVSTITPANAQVLGIPADSIGAYTSTFRAHTLTARNDTQLSPTQRLSFRYNYYYDRESPLQGGLISKEVATRFDESPYSFTGQLVSVIRPTLVNEARVLFANRGIENGVIDPDAPNINISGVASFNGNSNGTRVTRERGVHIVNNLTWTTGRHVVKGGIDLLPVNFRERTTNINGSFVFGGLPAVAGVRGAVTPLDQFLLTESGAIDPATGRPYGYSNFTQSIGAEFFDASTFNQGYFVQDDIRVTDRLKVNVGLRYEYFGRPEANPNPDLPVTASFPSDGNNLAPRVGVAYDPTGSGRTVLRGGLGVYYNVVVAQTYNNFLRSNGLDVINVNVGPSAPGAPPFSRTAVTPPSGVAVISDVRAMDPDFQDIRVTSWFATWENELFRDMAMSVSYQGNRADNLPLALNQNLRLVGTLPDGRRQWSTVGRPDARYGNIFVSTSAGEQRYDGFVATLTKRYSSGHSYQLSYHGSRATGTAFVNDFIGFGVFTSPSDPQDPSVDEGPSDFNMRHRFSATLVAAPRVGGLSGVADALVNGWQVSSRIIASDGFAFNATTGQDNNGDRVFNDRPVGQDYNTFTLPGYFTLDLRVDRRLDLGSGRALELILEGFNLTNRLNPTNVNRVWGPNATANANFNTPTAAETARQFQLAARFSF